MYSIFTVAWNGLGLRCPPCVVSPITLLSWIIVRTLYYWFPFACLYFAIIVNSVTTRDFVMFVSPGIGLCSVIFCFLKLVSLPSLLFSLQSVWLVFSTPRIITFLIVLSCGGSVTVSPLPYVGQWSKSSDVYVGWVPICLLEGVYTVYWQVNKDAGFVGNNCLRTYS